MNMELIPTGGQPLTMSSREIADLVESRHDDVKRSIKRLADRGVIVQPPMADEQDVDAMGRKRTTSVYLLQKRDTYVVVAQLSSELTARLVDRWQELEEQSQTFDPAAILESPAAMRSRMTVTLRPRRGTTERCGSLRLGIRRQTGDDARPRRDACHGKGWR